MTSQARIASNRANARGSTGPKSVGGKSLSRFNALKSGAFAAHNLLPGEDANAFETLSAQVQDHYHPSGPIEGFLVQRITRAMWRLERLEKAEYAALRRVEVKTVLRRDETQSSFTSDQFLAHKKSIETSVTDVLAQDSTLSVDADRAHTAEKTGDDQIVDVDKSELPPIAYTFLEGYAGDSDFRIVERIDQQKRALMREYLATIQMLRDIQADRKTVTVPGVEGAKPAPVRQIRP